MDRRLRVIAGKQRDAQSCRNFSALASKIKKKKNNKETKAKNKVKSKE